MFGGWLRGCTPSRGCSCAAVERTAPKPAGGTAGAAAGGAPGVEERALSYEAPPAEAAAASLLRPPPCPGPTPGGLPRLSVPPVFRRFQFSVIYTQLGATQGTLMEQQKAMLQAILRHFSKELTRGVAVSVVDPDGRISEYVCTLDKGMTQLLMRPAALAAAEEAAGGGAGAGATRTLAFREIERICAPEEMRNLRGVGNLLVHDECCTTVVLSGRRFVTFRLDSAATREYLMLCLQVLRMSQEKARMWYA